MSADQEMEGTDDLPEEDFATAYGRAPSSHKNVTSFERKTNFMPWHHPVKHVVRIRQWANLTRRLIEARAQHTVYLRYFTLPGPDLLDVRVLADVCAPLNVQIEYFGFDTGRETAEDMAAADDRPGAWINAESALRQAGRISADALILPDRLEDLAVEQSQAANQLRQRPAFDVINIDACDHLAYRAKGRNHDTFDAMQVLLKHQMGRREPWLLFVTTRADPHLLGDPGVSFQNAITQNLCLPGEFRLKLAECVGADLARLGSALSQTWNTASQMFLRLYSIGLGKFLLQFFHAQPNLPADVELASAYAYRVHGHDPDMLALAFRITPDPVRVYKPSTGGATVVPNLEPARATKVASQALKLQDLDRALETEPDVRTEAINGTEALLSSANYDVAAWRIWLDEHVRRHIVLR